MKRLMWAIIIGTFLACPVVAEKIQSFCEYGTAVALELGADGGTWVQTWHEKPCEWYECHASPNVGILGGNVVGQLSTVASGPPQIDWTQMITRIPLTGQLTLTAISDNSLGHDAGQIKGDFEGTFVVDGLAAHAEVDAEAGTITIPFGAAVEEGPDGFIEITETTGKFKNICAEGLWEWHVNGTITLARIPYLDLQTNILAALQNPNLILGAEEEVVLAGSYYRSSPTFVFCEYGIGESVQLGAGNALWNQFWGLGPWDWYECDASANANILTGDVRGIFRTTSAGVPNISDDLVLSLPFGGSLELFAYSERNARRVIGHIRGDITQPDGLFVVDLNPARAKVDEKAGTIELKIGAAIDTEAPVAPTLVTITETAGKFKSIKAEGKWEMHVGGVLLIEYDPDTYPMLLNNILAALGNPDLLLGATEELVLAGAYHRTSPNR